VQLTLVLQPLFQLVGAFLLAAVTAGVLRVFALLTQARGAVLTVGIICSCVLLYAYASPLGLSPVLAALFLGLLVRATDRSHSLLSHQTSETGAVLTLAYFILLGASLSWFPTWRIAGIAAAIVAIRLLAKAAVNALLAVPAALRTGKGAMVGLSLSPLSSLALMFAATIARHPGLEEAGEISAAVVLAMAILGPVLTEIAFRLAQEPTHPLP